MMIKSFLRLQQGLYLLGIIFLVSSCSEALSLGDQDPDYVVIQGTPTWENGMRVLIGEKCAICHQLPLPEWSPDTTPKDLDLRFLETANGVRGADILYLAQWIQSGILEKDLGEGEFVVRKMPLEYATPLISEEIEYFEIWAQNSRGL